MRVSFLADPDKEKNFFVRAFVNFCTFGDFKPILFRVSKMWPVFYTDTSEGEIFLFLSLCEFLSFVNFESFSCGSVICGPFYTDSDK